MAPKNKTTANRGPAAEKKGKAKVAEEAKAQATPQAVEATKRKAEEVVASEENLEPPKKESKTEEIAEAETDALSDKRPGLKQAVGFNLQDTTLNVIPIMDGQVLGSLSDGGLQYLIAGARANVGMKAGRYLFEVKTLEILHDPSAYGRNAPNRPILRFGFSTAGTSLVLGDSEEHIYFDIEGGLSVGRKRSNVMRKIVRDQTIGILLNLDEKSENKNTISCFVNGVRLSKPEPLPEGLTGKTLFPHVAFRNMKVMVHFGPEPQKALPFKCRSLAGAAAADIETAKSAKKDGKCEVMIPVGFPDEGTFEWVDDFLAANPHYFELSHRRILEWAASSGLTKHNHYHHNSRDKPEYSFGLPGMDDGSIRRILSSVAPLLPRNYVVMEVKNNLIGNEREALMRAFSKEYYKRVATVVMGDPPKEWKEKELAKFQKEKQAKADAAWRHQQAEKRKKKEAEKRQKELTEKRKKMEEDRKKKIEEAKKKAEVAKKKTEDGKKEDADKKDDDKVEKAMDVDEGGAEAEQKKEGEQEEEKKDEAMEAEEEEETEPPVIELTEEEKQLCFAPRSTPDLTVKEMSHSFAKFSIPVKTEGFDEIKFAWQPESSAKDYLRQKLLEKKKEFRVDDLAPGTWFHETMKAWNTAFAEWQAKLDKYKKSDAAKAKKDKKAEEEEEELEIDSVDNIMDVGNGVPLFKDFAPEDWALLQLRFELFLLQAAFKKDVDDEDRPGIQERHFGFYFHRYFKKYPHFKGYGVDDSQGLVKLMKDTVAWENDLLVPKIDISAEDFPVFVKLCESHRRERQRRLDAGDESARLKVAPDAMKGVQHGKGGRKGSGKGSGKGGKKG